jgi:hypothetical protein
MKRCRDYSPTRLETPVVDALRGTVKQKNTSRRATGDAEFRLAEEDDVANYTVATCLPNVPWRGFHYSARSLANKLIEPRLFTLRQSILPEVSPNERIEFSGLSLNRDGHAERGKERAQNEGVARSQPRRHAHMSILSRVIAVDYPIWSAHRAPGTFR